MAMDWPVIGRIGRVLIYHERGRDRDRDEEGNLDVRR